MNGIVRNNLTLVVSGNCSLFSGKWLLKQGKDNICWIQDTCTLDKVTFYVSLVIKHDGTTANWMLAEVLLRC